MTGLSKNGHILSLSFRHNISCPHLHVTLKFPLTVPCPIVPLCKNPYRGPETQLDPSFRVSSRSFYETVSFHEKWAWGSVPRSCRSHRNQWRPGRLGRGPVPLHRCQTPLTFCQSMGGITSLALSCSQIKGVGGGCSTLHWSST